MTIGEPRPWASVDIAETYRILNAPVRVRAGCEAGEPELIACAAPVWVDIQSDEFPRNADGETLKPQLLQALLGKLATN